MDRMFVDTAPLVTTPPEEQSTGNRSPAEMHCIEAGTIRAASMSPRRAAPVQPLRFPAAQAARWRRRGEPVRREAACRFTASSGRSLCT